MKSGRSKKAMWWRDDYCCCLDKGVLWLICGYAPQSGWSLDEKQSFYDEL